AASPAAAPSPQAAASPSPSPQPAAAERKGRLVVIGDADFASNQWFGHPANRELVVGALAWLAAEEAILSIQRPEAVSAPLFLTPAQSAAALLVAFLLPLGAAGAGVAVWLVRRRR
ncbi:MAG TPA: hypothetical protein VNM66_02545, partial [Thermodesulfobacteriota bacterium]|nr:hypothetical protein [Thermodesulfobacteriota bacterium]